MYVLLAEPARLKELQTWNRQRNPCCFRLACFEPHSAHSRGLTYTRMRRFHLGHWSLRDLAPGGERLETLKLEFSRLRCIDSADALAAFSSRRAVQRALCRHRAMESSETKLKTKPKRRRREKGEYYFTVTTDLSSDDRFRSLAPLVPDTAEANKGVAALCRLMDLYGSSANRLTIAASCRGKKMR